MHWIHSGRLMFDDNLMIITVWQLTETDGVLELYKSDIEFIYCILCMQVKKYIMLIVYYAMIKYHVLLKLCNFLGCYMYIQCKERYAGVGFSN